MAAGTGSYFLAISGTFIISSIALILHKTNFGSIIKSEFILQFRTPSNNSKFQNFLTKLFLNFQNLQHY